MKTQFHSPRALGQRFVVLILTCLALVLPSTAQIDLSFANLVQATDGNNAQLGPSYSGLILNFTDVAPGSGLDIDLKVTVSNVSTNYYFSASFPNYKSTTVVEPNNDLGYLYYHDDTLPFTIGGVAYTLEFYEGGGTFTTPTVLPAFQFLIYDVDGEPLRANR